MSDTKSKEPPGILKALAFIFALLLVISMPLALLSFDVWRVVFNPPVVKQFITDEAVNSNLLPVALGWFSERRAQERVAKGEALSGVNEPDIVLLLSYLTFDDWKKIKTEVLSSEFVTHLVSVTVDGTYAWIDSNDKVPKITWELQPFIDRVRGENGKNAVLVAYNKLPKCTDPEIADFLGRLSKAPPGVQVLYNLCMFPDPWHDDQVQDYVDALQGVVKNVPPKFALTEEILNVAAGGGTSPDALKKQARDIRTMAMWAGAVPLVLVLLIVLVVVRNVDALGRWVGIPLIVGGLITLLPTLVYRSIITSILSSGVLGTTPEIIKQEVINVITRAADLIFQPMMIQAIIVMVVGILLVAWMFIASRKTTTQTSTAK